MRCINAPVTAGEALMAALLALSPLGYGWAFDNPLAAGIAAYNDGDYRAAADRFAEAVTAAPQDSMRHHWLGKSYGRIAEHSNWFVSMSYAKKTLQQFRAAVALDADNYEAVRDLADYLESAPRFLGGDKQEAARLKQQLERLRGDQ
ncbi:MAG: hypothetical protein OXF58_06385 [Gammaproteobacteria bacterium]|nr:hypothetical protein [Gammaproteobacteria bacterium]